jgi:hypothetical protein
MNVMMKGRTPTREERVFMDKVASIGCIACLLDGRVMTEVSIHHIDGRVKPGAHFKVLPLCAGHHQEGTGIPGLIAVHPWKARFEAMYGQQEELLQLVRLLIEYMEMRRRGVDPSICKGEMIRRMAV